MSRHAKLQGYTDALTEALMFLSNSGMRVTMVALDDSAFSGLQRMVWDMEADFAAKRGESPPVFNPDNSLVLNGPHGRYYVTSSRLVGISADGAVASPRKVMGAPTAELLSALKKESTG